MWVASGTEIRTRKDAIGRVPVEGSIGVVEKGRRRLSAIIRPVIKVAHRAVIAAVRNPNDAIHRNAASDFRWNSGPTLVGSRLTQAGHRDRGQSRSGNHDPCGSHLQTFIIRSESSGLNLGCHNRPARRTSSSPIRPGRTGDDPSGSPLVLKGLAYCQAGRRGPSMPINRTRASPSRN